MGICGTAMAALAGLLQARGLLVSGSDQQVYPPMSDFLAGLGIEVLSGYRAEHLALRPDLVIVGNVITRANPEAQALAELRLPYLSLPQAVGHFLLAGKTSLVVTGTHGKTTTSSLLASMLHYLGTDPGFMIGGIVQEFGRNFRLGQGPYCVVEGDEYDTAFFDKGPKFLHYRPRIAVITSIEFDHADIYADLEAVIASFRRLVAIMPKDGALIANLDDPVVVQVCQEANCPVLGYGEGQGLTWRLAELDIRPDGTWFSACKDGQPQGRFHTRMPGRHNALNSLAVLAVLERLGFVVADLAGHLPRFPGVRRRQEVRGEVDGVTVIDDFAHHPTAVRETLAALRAAYPGRRLVAVFEPRTNSSRRRVFQEDYALVFDQADEVIVKEPPPLAALSEESRFSATRLIADLNRRGLKAAYQPDTGSIIEDLTRSARPGDVIAIMSNGGFDNIHPRLLDRLAHRGGHL
ncbi:MAG: UDP-N-acetylmuramate--L-alanine ligase [Desulfobacteraceae bacterium]|nr:UDP-N-acetylmuramate--L-alanine ligase [Desulfobacteraceae bacterium]